ncbi:DUF4304 domain-containing protein [Ralstonia solanacearum]|uniref:DUF4304 domain-containing protein n=1 Tax=Ralstonia solanacearum TaxID=305 RepID=A0AAW5ZSH2_RALSL|nr:DUF4304 domain-containing protein [Ralstonia solanacearum]MDB0572943.1 DUF4304 domain-containing protein [Ralstonia solanacearum]
MLVLSSNNLRIMIDSKIIKMALGAPLIEAGFKKKSDSWYFGNDEVVLLVNIQKSQYGDQYYVNCGISVRSLGGVEFPKEQNCHIRFRLTAIFPEEKRKEFEALFDLESELFSDHQRSEEISRIVKNIVLPILQRCSYREGIVEAVRSGALANAMVYKEIKEWVD